MSLFPLTKHVFVSEFLVLFVFHSNPSIQFDSFIPFSFSSLKVRLEAYYSLIAPDAISDRIEWGVKFEQIYHKYGSSYEGEQTLANKLAKKYGTTIRLLVAKPQSVRRRSDETTRRDNSGSYEEELGDDHQTESCYELRPEERTSGDIRFESNRFNPMAALEASEFSMMEQNPILKDCLRLDTVAQFALHLPNGDPQRVEPTISTGRRKRSLDRTQEQEEGILQNNTNKKGRSDLHLFEKIVQSVPTNGPLRRLEHFRKQRIRIVIRYVNAIRGELYGILIVFDKHMNMILRDVEEIYSMRPISVNGEHSNVEMEKYRRTKLRATVSEDDSNISSTIEGGRREWYGRKRRMKHLLVRGDNVVSISLADQEKKDVTTSRYTTTTKTTTKELETILAKETPTS